MTLQTRGMTLPLIGAVGLMLAIWGGVANAASTPTTPDGTAIVARRAGDVRVVDEGSRSRDLQRGGSATEFALRPPDGASCPGDSQNDQWRVNTFIVPVDDDPGTLKYSVIGPTGTNQSAVWGTDFTPVLNQFTVPNDQPGKPGLIDRLRPMSYGVFQPRTLADGTYKIGVACTYFGWTADYWDTEIVITNTPSDEPAQLTWRLSSASAVAPETSSGTPSWLIIGIAAAAAIVAVVVVRVVRGRQRVGVNA